MTIIRATIVLCRTNVFFLICFSESRAYACLSRVIYSRDPPTSIPDIGSLHGCDIEQKLLHMLVHLCAHVYYFKQRTCSRSRLKERKRERLERSVLLLLMKCGGYLDVQVNFLLVISSIDDFIGSKAPDRSSRS